MYRIGWFSSGRDKAARQLLTTVRDSIERGEIQAEIAFVFCSRAPGESKESDLFLALARKYGLRLVCLSWKRFVPSGEMDRRLEYDRLVMARLDSFRVDLCLLAGHMLIVGPEMCRRYNMINLHPALPGGPTGTWQEVIRKLIDARAGETGVMMHLVTPDLDGGPVVAYCRFPIRGKPFDRYWKEVEGLPSGSPARHSEDNRLFRAIRRHGLALEFPLIVATLKAFSEGKVKITPDKKVVDSNGHPIKGYDLTEEIEKQLG